MTRKFTTLIFTIFAACGMLVAQPTGDILKEIKAKHAPDKRTVLYDVQVDEYKSVAVVTGRTTSKEALDETIERLNAKFEGKQLVNEVRLLPDAKMKGEVYGVIDIAVATVRREGNYSSEQLTQLLMGMPVRVLDDNGWFYVQTPEGYLGWVAKRGVKTMTREEYNAWVEADKVVYMPTTGWIYEQPDLKSAHVTDITAGSIVLNKGKAKGKFIAVELPKGRKGYLLSSDVVDFEVWKKRRPTADAVIAEAKNLLGTSYLWAGTSTKMLDCSGMAKTVYLLNGLVLARDASQQCLTGDNIDVSDKDWTKLKKGDLVFFGSKRVTHVGVYIGEGKFIHEAGLIHISSFNPEHEDIYSKYWLDQLIRATRIIGTEDSGKGVWSVENCPLYNKQ